MQTDGKVVVVGDDSENKVAVVRYNSDGTVDGTFGTSGVMRFRFRDDVAVNHGNSVAIEADGKILVAGSFGSGLGTGGIGAARLTSNGSFDSTFGTGGRSLPPLQTTGSFIVSDLVIQNGQDQDATNDLPVIVGSFSGSGGFAIRMSYGGIFDNNFTPGGDNNFGIDLGPKTKILGAAVDYSVPGPGPNPNFQDIIVVGTSTPSGTTTPQFAIARLSAQDGHPNSVFSGDGKLVMPFDAGYVDSEAAAVVIQHTGKMVVVGKVQPNSSAGFDFGAIRLNINGMLDNTFGPSSNGRSQIDLGTSNDAAQSIIIGQTGKLILGGVSGTSMALACLSSDGVIDPIFGSGGKTITSFGTSSSASGLVGVLGGTIVAAGGANFATARFFDRGPTVSLTSIVSDAYEAGQVAGSFRFSRAENLGVATRVYFSAGGSATPPGLGGKGDYTGIDINPLFRFVDIPANQTSVTVTITPKDDALVEPTESATLTISPAAGYDIASPSSASVIIHDNDAQIGGEVFNDANASSSLNASESGIGSWTVYLDANNNKKLDTGEISTTTNSDGFFAFGGLAAGSYNIRQVQQGGWRRTLPAGSADSYTVSVGGAAVNNINFGMTHLARITGQVFKDLDRDGVKDSNEGGFAGVTVYLDMNNNKALDSTEPKKTTDSSGNYAFDSLLPSTYNVRAVPPATYSQSLPLNNASYALTLGNGANLSNINFGMKPPAVVTTDTRITGDIWNDLDGDGTRDVVNPTEPNFIGWIVWLDTNNNGTPDTGEPNQKTDGGGNFAFTNLTSGVTYHLRSELKSGWRRTTAGVFNITPTSGQNVVKHFGVTQKILISGNVFNDPNSNGIKDSGERGLSGWKVWADKDNDGVIDSNEEVQTSDSNGNWSFKDLVAGTYVVRIVQQAGFTRTAPTTNNGTFAVTLTSGQSATGKQFGEHASA